MESFNFKNILSLNLTLQTDNWLLLYWELCNSVWSRLIDLTTVTNQHFLVD